MKKFLAVIPLLLFLACNPYADLDASLYSVSDGSFFRAKKIWLKNADLENFEIFQNGQNFIVDAKSNFWFVFEKNGLFVAKLENLQIKNITPITQWEPAGFFETDTTQTPKLSIAFQKKNDPAWWFKTIEGNTVFDSTSFVLQPTSYARITKDSIKVRGVLPAGGVWTKNIANRADFKPTNSAKGGGPLGDLPDYPENLE